MKNIILCLFLLPLSLQSQRSRPNIIYIYADDLGYGELGCYGQQKIKTPHLDRLAKEGMRFTQHYSSAPVCAPSRCMLMTGRHGGHSYIRGNYELGGFADSTEGGQMPLPEQTFTVAKMLQQAGYVTGAIGKWGLGMHYTTGDPNKQGFDYFYGYLCQKQAHNFYPTHLWENGKWDALNNPPMMVHTPLPAGAPDSAFNYFKGKDYALDKIADKTSHFIKKNKDKPFFLYLPITAPHVSLQAPDAAVDAYKGQFPETPYYGQRGYSSTPYPRATYAAMVSYLDKQVGMVLQLLKDLKLDDNTLIMFSSDNGATFDVGGADTEFFNSVGGLRGRKMDLYEGGIRVPFIVRWHNTIKAEQVSDHVAVQYDLMATLADLLRLKVPQNDGVSYLPTLLGKPNAQQKRSYLYFEYPEKGGQLAIRLGDFKGVKLDMKKNKSAVWEIYNLKTDRNETTNIADQHPELVKEFDTIVKKEHRFAHIKEWEFVQPKW
jgi:arylsulfatase A